MEDATCDFFCLKDMMVGGLLWRDERNDMMYVEVGDSDKKKRKRSDEALLIYWFVLFDHGQT